MKRPIISGLYNPLAQARKVVKTDNRVAQAHKPLSWAQFRILMCILAQGPSSSNFGNYKTTLAELMHLSGLSAWKDKTAIIEAIISISTCVIVLPDFNHPKNGVGYNFVSLFHRVHWNEQTESIFFELHDDIKDLSVGLQDHFTLVNYREFQQLGSFRAGQLFMLMSYCQNFHSEEKRTFEIGWLCEYLNINKAAKWKDIWIALQRTRMIICSNTDSILSLSPQKKNRQDLRRVTHITLNIHRRASMKKPRFPQLEDYVDCVDDA